MTNTQEALELAARLGRFGNHTSPIAMYMLLYEAADALSTLVAERDEAEAKLAQVAMIAETYEYTRISAILAQPEETEKS